MMMFYTNFDTIAIEQESPLFEKFGFNIKMWPWTTKPVINSTGIFVANSQLYIEWVKSIDFYFMPKITRILSKDHVI